MDNPQAPWLLITICYTALGVLCLVFPTMVAKMVRDVRGAMVQRDFTNPVKNPREAHVRVAGAVFVVVGLVFFFLVGLPALL
jgi:uncharacterized protein YjeT (DUF2065 family)